MMHNPETTETFIPMTGTWRCSWENEKGQVESIDLNPLDVISFPPGAIRRFENIQPAESGEDAVLMFVIGGNAPKAEFTDKAVKELKELGVWPQTSQAIKAESGTPSRFRPNSYAACLKVGKYADSSAW